MNIPQSLPEPMDLSLHETASEWWMRRQDASWTQQEEALFQDWLAAAPEHRRIFDKLSRTWTDFSGVPRPALASDAVRSAGVPESPVIARVARVPGAAAGFWSGLFARRVLAPAAIALCAFLSAGGWYWWDNTPGYTLDVATQAGEVRSIDLPDGTHVDLNFSSKLQVRYYPRRRETSLGQGEAFFKVAADSVRPFTVDSGASRVTVVGTSFNVRAAPPQLLIQVLEGRVHVTLDRTRPENRVALSPEQGLVIDPASGKHRAAMASAERIGDWRSGRLVFRRTPLSEVAQEVERYLGQPVRVRGDDRLRQLTVSGFADIQAPGVFLEALPDLLPVRLDRNPAGGYVISGR